MKFLPGSASVRIWCALLFSAVLQLASKPEAQAQADSLNASAVRFGLGAGLHDGARESGLGLVYQLGWQKSYGAKDKFSLNPNVVHGSFSANDIDDARDQFYQLSSLGLQLHYDLIRVNAVSVVVSGGAFVAYTRGLLGTGGDPRAARSEYFRKVYVGGLGSAGIRINPPRSRIAYELRPITISSGTNGFLLFYPMLNLEFKLGKLK
jgi:hypothetical protein